MNAPFQTEIDVRWRDLDAFNHVNNSNYLSYLEEARIRWFDEVKEAWLTDEFAPVLASVTVNYKRPIEYPARITVELFTTRVGGSSVTVGHRMLGADGTLHSDGEVAVVWVERATGKPRPLPDGVRRAAEMLLAPQ